jgi:signal transduction histidine kinase
MASSLSAPRATAAEAATEPQAAYYGELLHAIAQMHEANDRRSVALAGAVHDLKTPLAVITGFVNLLLGEKLGTLTPRQQEALKDVSGCCRRLNDAVGKLLFHTANELKKQPLRFEPADLRETVQQIRTFWSPVFMEKGIALECQVPDEPFCFTFDAAKVQQVISNLLENALKFTPAGGSVSVTAFPHFWDRRSERRPVPTERRTGMNHAPNSAKIVVADTGMGIDPEHQQDIFEEFFSLSVPGVTPGIGLGLTIARHLVQAHHGKIWVESRAGEGAQFVILLPFKPQ